MSYEHPSPEQPQKERRYWPSSLERFGSLTVGEFVALNAQLHSSGNTLDGMGEPVYSDNIYEALEDGIEHNLPDVLPYLHAFADSPRAEDRVHLTNWFVAMLTEVDHDTGVALWKRLMADPDQEVRERARDLLEDTIGPAIPEEADVFYVGLRDFYAVKALDEAKLVESTGLSRQDVYDLYLSHAYAENGEYFDLGQAALAKIVAVQPPVE